MTHETPTPLRFPPLAAAESCNPGPMGPWHGPGLQPPIIDPETGLFAPPEPGPLQRACEWLADCHQDLITLLVLFTGAYLILMLLAAAERADLLAGWL